MKRATFSRSGCVFGAALLGILTGCVGYVDRPQAGGGYYQEPPPPREVYVPAPVAPAVSVEVVIRSDNDFYEPLTPYGRWVVVGAHGRCWIPGRVEAGWRPYSNGNWRRTDAGWYWVSDEPWGWATYHYGRWDFSGQIGWYWVPQTQWAPAWVSWHEGGGYVGWAPLQPSVIISPRGYSGYSESRVSPQAYVFVEQRRFLQPVRPATIVVNNTTIIKNTVTINNVTIVNNTVINEGPRTQIIEQASGQRIQAVPVRELRRKQEADAISREHATSPSRGNQAGMAPARGAVPSDEAGAHSNTQRRAQEVEKQNQSAQSAGDAGRAAQAESRRNASGLEKQAQLDSERRAKAADASAREQSQRDARNAKSAARLDLQRQANEAAVKSRADSERAAQREALQRRQDLENKTQAEAQKNSREVANQNRAEVQQRAREAAATQQAAARGQAQASTRTTERGTQPRRQDFEPQVQTEAGVHAQGRPELRNRQQQLAPEAGGTNSLKKAKKGKGKWSPPQDPPGPPPASP